MTAMDSRIHVLEKDGKRLYRVWDHRTDEYVTDELTREQLAEHQLHSAVTRALEVLRPMQQFERNLTGSGWWRGTEKAHGALERATDLEDRDPEAEVREAEELARFAVSAIQAYRAYRAHFGTMTQPEVRFSFEKLRIEGQAR